MSLRSVTGMMALTPAGLSVSALRAHAALHHLDAPPEEARQAVAVAEGALVHAPVLEHAVCVVAHGVPVPVPPVHVRHHALQLLEAQVLVHHRVGAELGEPRGAAEQHRVRVTRAEVPRAEELQEHHVDALVVDQGRGGGGVRRAEGGEWGFSGTPRMEMGSGSRLRPRPKQSHLAGREIWALVQGAASRSDSPMARKSLSGRSAGTNRRRVSSPPGDRTWIGIRVWVEARLLGF
jgi:hypothetical protein